MKTQSSTRRLAESHGQYAAVVYGRNSNSNFPLLRLDYAVLATGGTGFIMWWDGGFNQDSTKCYIVDMDMNPFDMIERAMPVCSHIVVTVAAIDEIERRGEASRLEALQAKAFDSHNVTESAGTFGVHGYVVWGCDTNLEVPGCVIDYGSGLGGESFECFHRANIISQNMKQLLLARNDDPIALLRAARKRHSYVVITLRAMSIMQQRGLDLSSIRESTAPSEKRGVQSVREAANTLRSGVGNVNEARNTLIGYGFTPESLSEITMSRTSSTASLIARIDRLCEISTGALVWASKHAEAFPESRNKIGGSKGKYKARKVGQYGAKSLVNESGDWAVFVQYLGDGQGPYDVVSRHPTQADAEQRLKREISQRKLKHPDTFKDAWVAMHPDAALRDYKKRKGVNEGQVPSEDQSDDEIYDDCRGYCRNATDRQLRNIYADEKQRARRNPGEVGRVAKIFARAAKDEMEKRGIDESRVVEGDEKETYIAHARKLLRSSEAAVEDTDSRHGSPFGLGYRSYLKTILRGDNPSNFKPKGDHLAGWAQARKDLASLDPMTEARKGPASTLLAKSSSVSESTRWTDLPPGGEPIETLIRAGIASIEHLPQWKDAPKPDPSSSFSMDAGEGAGPTRGRIVNRMGLMIKRSVTKGQQVFTLDLSPLGGGKFRYTVGTDVKANYKFTAAQNPWKNESTVNEVAGYTLRDSDKKAVKAWVQQKPAEGKWVISDGTTLRTTSLGAADMAKWINGKPHIGMAYGNTTQTLINFIRKELRDQGMTTLGKLTTKGEPVSDESQPYRTINDAGKKIPDLSEGATEVWFSKARTLDESTIRPATLPDTHVLVGKVKCSSPSRLFVLLQEEKWSPHGEATDMLRARGVVHSSLSVGDVIVTGGRHYMVAEHGFKRLDN